jgi:hypothetical protein
MPHPLDKEFKLIQEVDRTVLEDKDATYKGSWHKRGGIGAFMMLARKWDRLEGIAEANGYDIFKIIAELNKYSTAEGGLRAEIGDLRRYLLLVEAYMVRQHNDETLTDKHYGVEPHYDSGAREKILEHLHLKGSAPMTKSPPVHPGPEKVYSACPESVGQGGPDMRPSKMMDRVKCISCGALWVNKYKFCPNCGKSLEVPSQKQSDAFTGSQQVY